MTTSAEVRSHLIRAMQLDLVGPTPDDVEYAEEILSAIRSVETCIRRMTGFD
ncbi:hypothetical protein [Nostoc sphaeroides]|uniref:Uncharacterized protein n=1 Tax=Nostoc sphaeroides CCNUC1 TaxID=2653204 RepID=A0A5P8WHM6_9NOSO|nr:hypothetical protein [Nostoc sphaeroides]QFS52100.1 hypothetical protein GXM_09594 [Nostoc sphaeroides CCNUC1]